MIKEIIKDINKLNKKASLCTDGDLKYALDLKDTLNVHKHECVGMALNMIGINKAMIIVTLKDEDLVMVNPRIINKKNPYFTEESCLSLSYSSKVIRYQEIEVEYYDTSMKKHRTIYKDYPAQIIQHECDHLKGIII